MFQKVKDKIDAEIEKIDADDIKNGTKTLAKEASEVGVEIVKGGISSILNTIFMKLLFFVIVVVLIIGGGCVGTNMLIDKQEKTEWR